MTDPGPDEDPEGNDQEETDQEGTGQEEAGQEEAGHDASGLDLARALARATASVRPTPGAPAGPGGAGRPRRRSGTADAAVAGLARPRSDVGSRRRGGLSGSGADERDPQTVDATLDRLVTDHGWALDLRVAAVIGRWAELVGPEVAGHCTPESFAEARLVVRTDSTAWATQLKLLAPTIVRRLNEELGHGTVRVIDVLGPHLPTWTKGRRSVRGGRGPRDTYG